MEAAKTILALLSLFIIYVWITTWWTSEVFDIVWLKDDPSMTSFIWGCIAAPFWEEAVYRMLPISVAKKLGQETIIPVVLASSVIFGLGHGYLGLFLQGVIGLGLCYTYLKHGYFSSVALHALYNFSVVYILPTYA